VFKENAAIFVQAKAVRQQRTLPARPGILGNEIQAHPKVRLDSGDEVLYKNCKFYWMIFNLYDYM